MVKVPQVLEPGGPGNRIGSEIIELALKLFHLCFIIVPRLGEEIKLGKSTARNSGGSK